MSDRAAFTERAKLKNSRNCSFLAASIFSLIFLLSGCENFGTVEIGRIIQNPREYTGKKVSVSGEVTEVFGFFVIKYFIVQDKTGQIPVVTEKVLPKKGSKITVRGTVKEAFALLDQQLIVLIEDPAQ